MSVSAHHNKSVYEAEKCFLWLCVYTHKWGDLVFLYENNETVEGQFWGIDILYKSQYDWPAVPKYLH